MTGQNGPYLAELLLDNGYPSCARADTVPDR
jgi:hypothetical protein